MAERRSLPLTARPRDALGRFAAVTVAQDWTDVQADYEHSDLTNRQVADKHDISESFLHTLVVRHGWKRRLPRRVDRSDMVERMMRLLDRQLTELETGMNVDGATGPAVLVKLVGTLDKLIAIKEAENRRRSVPKAYSEEMIELRAKIADRIAELNKP